MNHNRVCLVTPSWTSCIQVLYEDLDASFRTGSDESDSISQAVRIQSDIRRERTRPRESNFDIGLSSSSTHCPLHSSKFASNSRQNPSPPSLAASANAYRYNMRPLRIATKGQVTFLTLANRRLCRVAPVCVRGTAARLDPRRPSRCSSRDRAPLSACRPALQRPCSRQPST